MKNKKVVSTISCVVERVPSLWCVVSLAHGRVVALHPFVDVEPTTQVTFIDTRTAM